MSELFDRTVRQMKRSVEEKMVARNELLRKRRALCLRIAEQLERQYDLRRTDWDTDEAGHLIEGLLPMTYAEEEAFQEEAREELERLPPRQEKIQGHSLNLRLREALGLMDVQVSLQQVLLAALERIERCTQAEAFLRESLDQLRLSNEEYHHGTPPERLKCMQDFLGRKT